MSQAKTPSSGTNPSRKPRYFYGWNIVGATFLANISYAEHFSSILGLFFKPLQQEFGWSRTALATVQTIARVVEAILAPIIGPFIDRYGPRVLMPIGAIVVGLSMLAVTQINAIWQFYLLRGAVVAIGFTIMGQLVTSVAISNWFVRKRGRALAISRLGSNISNIVFIPVTVFVIGASGWRTMFVIFAVVTWLFAMIPSAIFMRRRPEDMGLYPDGITPENYETSSTSNEKSKPTVTVAPEPIWSRREVLSTRTFWLLAFCFGVDSMALQGINISLAPYVQDLGYGDATLTAVLSFRAIIMAAALPFVGFISEYTHKLYVRIGSFIIQGIAAFLFIFAEQSVFLWLAVVVYALGSSALGVITEVIWANYFGRLSLGLVRSLSFLVSFGFGAIGPLAMNAAFDLLGSYRPAFIVIGGAFILSALLMTITSPPKAKRYATASEVLQRTRN